MKEFYDKIYRDNPNKWSGIDRDYQAFKIISHMVNPSIVLDFGCGNGHTLALFKSQWHGMSAFGIDMSEEARQLTKRRVPKPISVYESLDQLPERVRFDAITVMGVAEHFLEPGVELVKIADRLSEKGILYLECPNCLIYSDDKTEGYRETYKGSGQKEWHLTRQSWDKLLGEAGLNIVSRMQGFSHTCEFVWIIKK
jgi:SAM-dependent methyltransferase